MRHKDTEVGNLFLKDKPEFEACLAREGEALVQEKFVFVIVIVVVYTTSFVVVGAS